MSENRWHEEINDVLMNFGVISKPFMEGAAEALETVLQDYTDLAAQYSELVKHYCREQKPNHLDGEMYCPNCGKKVYYYHKHCHACGKKLLK